MYEYRKLSLGGHTSLVKEGTEDRLKGVDGLAFDCDGTLVDVSGSFVRATFDTAEMLISSLHGRRVDFGNSGMRMLTSLRKTGQYNNDWDSTFAIVCFVSMALEGYDGRRSEVTADELVDRAGSIGRDFIAGNRSWDVEGVRRFTQEYYRSRSREGECARIFEFLNYPGLPPGSRLSTAYDKLYYGTIDGLPPGGRNEDDGKGLFRTERLLVDETDLLAFADITGKKPALLTGRPRKMLEVTMGSWMRYFDLEASMFIGDIGLDDYAGQSAYRKPLPGSLLRAMERMKSSRMLYAGDSGEDIGMASAAREKGADVLFAGVVGSTTDPDGFRAFFRDAGADIIVDGPAQLKRLLDSVMR